MQLREAAAQRRCNSGKMRLREAPAQRRSSSVRQSIIESVTQPGALSSFFLRFFGNRTEASSWGISLNACSMNHTAQLNASSGDTKAVPLARFTKQKTLAKARRKNSKTREIIHPDSHTCVSICFQHLSALNLHIYVNANAHIICIYKDENVYAHVCKCTCTCVHK